MIQLFFYMLILLPLSSFACDNKFSVMYLNLADKMENVAEDGFDPYDYSDSVGRISIKDTSLEVIPQVIQELFKSEEQNIENDSDVIHVISNESSGDDIKVFGLSEEDIKRLEGKSDFSECFEITPEEAEKSLMKRWCHAIAVDYMGSTMEKQMNVDKPVAKLLAMAALFPKEKEVVFAEVPIVTDKKTNTQLTMTAFGNKVLFFKFAVPLSHK